MAPARLPSGSWKKIRVPTVGIVTFGITILPPIFSIAAWVASMSSTPKLHSMPVILRPGISSLLGWMAAITPGLEVLKKPGGPQGSKLQPKTFS